MLKVNECHPLHEQGWDHDLVLFRASLRIGNCMYEPFSTKVVIIGFLMVFFL